MTPALGHDAHAHPLDPQPGCSGTFPTQNGGHSSDSNLFYVADAAYTDGGVRRAGAHRRNQSCCSPTGRPSTSPTPRGSGS